MTQSAGVPPFVNRTMKFVLRSLLHGMVSKSILLITFIGRKSGKTYSTPVSYSQQGDAIFIFTHADWWKNLSADRPVTLRIRGREFQARTETVADDKQAIAAGLGEHLKQVPSDARYYHVTLDAQKNSQRAELDQAAQTVVMIRAHLC